jgi:hypothetical protein
MNGMPHMPATPSMQRCRSFYAFQLAPQISSLHTLVTKRWVKVFSLIIIGLH